MTTYYVSPGEKPPDSINVVIEIPRGSNVKYEVNPETGIVSVDRFLYTATCYPFNYGFIPGTKEQDGDALDAMLLCQESIFPKCVVSSRPIGVLLMEDQSGPDSKIIALPSPKVDPSQAAIDSIDQLSSFTRLLIEHFFEHYKETEPNKPVKIKGWRGAKESKRLIKKAIDAYERSSR